MRVFFFFFCFLFFFVVVFFFVFFFLLPMRTKIINDGLSKMFVKPLFIFYIIFLLDLELNCIDKLYVFR